MVIFIIVITIALSLLAFRDARLFDKWLFLPYRLDDTSQWYRFISHGFIHADWMHLALNMFVFYSFGNSVQAQITAIKGPGIDQLYFGSLYIIGMVVAAMPAYIKHRHNPNYRSLGASGAVAAVLFFFILFNPLQKIIFLFLPIPIPAFVFGILYLVYEYYMDKRQNTGVAHDAHFWGALFGVVFAIVVYPPVVSHFISQIAEFVHL